MPLRSDVVGFESEPIQVEVTPRLAMAYAAGVGDRNPCYFDDAAAESVLAPPAYCTSIEWEALAAVRHHDGLGATREEALRGVHAAQDSIFHRPIRAGDSLSATVRIVALRAAPPGALMTSRFDTVCARSGDPFVTSYMTTIYRGVAVEGENRALEEIPALPGVEAADDGSPPKTERVSIPIAPEAPHVYTECASIWNPIHTERRVARAAGLPDIILHGTATWALAAREIVDRCCGRDPTRLRRLVGRFAAMVIPGTAIELAYEARGGDVAFTVSNDRGEAAIAKGRALLD